MMTVTLNQALKYTTFAMKAKLQQLLSGAEWCFSSHKQQRETTNPTQSPQNHMF